MHLFLKLRAFGGRDSWDPFAQIAYILLLASAFKIFLLCKWPVNRVCLCIDQIVISGFRIDGLDII